MAFKDGEIAAIRPALNSAVTMTYMLGNLADMMLGMTTTSRPALANSVREGVRTMRDVTSGVFALIGALPEHLSGRAAVPKLGIPLVPEATRAAQLDFAFDGPPFSINRAVHETLPAFMLVEPRMSDVVGTVRQTLANLDRAALLHSDPPPGGTFGGRRAIIGPHGDYYESQHFAASAVHYLNDWAQEGFATIMVAVPVTTYRAHLANAFKVYSILVRTYIEGAALNAGISLHTRWDNLAPVQGNVQFARTLAALGLFTRAVRMQDGDGAPEFYAALGDAWLALLDGTPSLLRESWKRGQNRLNDSWRRGNEAAWKSMFFPDRRAD